jgi:hypothetical protein
VFFAPHVFFVGYLVFRSGYFPKLLGILAILASLSYLIDGFASLLLISYEVTPVFLAVPIAIVEMSFPFWLLVKGVDVEQWKKHTIGAHTEGIGTLSSA